MPTFMTRHGRVSFTAKNPGRKKPSRKTSPKDRTYSKKVGRWRVECKGRTVYAAGAKHSYKTPAAACAAYKRLNSVKSIENFVARYGKKATKAAVLKHNPCGSTRKGTKKRRKNAPVRASDAAAMRRILRAHGF